MRVARPRIGQMVAVAALLVGSAARADEGGVSFWLPGQFSSFAAVPGEPGWSVPTIYFHEHASAGGEKNFIIGGNLTAGVDAKADLLFFFPTYTFKEPVSGAQVAFGLGWAVAHMKATADVAVSGPQGRAFGGSRTDKVDGGSDIYGLGTLKWHDANNNWLAYGMLNIPTGAYQVGRIANIGINHNSVDGGGGYTYLDAKKGHEVSIVGGLTYNWENNDTHYKNGMDGHIDWAASQFLSEQLHVGVVGYYFHQLTGDSGSGATLGDFKSQVAGIGPQAGYFFPVGKSKGYVNLKGYWEFAEQNRASGWNLWLTLALPLE